MNFDWRIGLALLPALIAGCAEENSKVAGSGETAAVAPQANVAESIRLPEGFRIEVFASDLPDARSLAWSPAGIIYIGTRSEGAVYALRLDEGGRPAGAARVIARGLNMPNGVAWRDGSLFVAEVNRILRYDRIDERLGDPPQPEIIVDDLPTERHHGWKYIAFGPDDKLYVPVGAPCNVCEKEGYAQILRMAPDGTGRETVALGVRNTVGFDWHPESGELWFTDNGRDMLGDDIPPCELNRVARAGEHFGFPYCHGKDVSDPGFGEARSCGEFRPPARELGPHVAPLGMKFYTGAMFPEEYRHHVFIAEHGSWNRSKKIGYRVMLVRLAGNDAVTYEPFAHGWLRDEAVSGRPVDILQLPDGSLIVSDDMGGRLYRITYEN